MTHRITQSLQYAPPTTGNPSAFRVKGCPRCAAWSDPELKKVLRD